MKFKDLLAKGYIPRELPPPFTSKYFTDFYIANKKDFSQLSRNDLSKGIEFSSPKPGNIRQDITLTNPFHQSELCDFIATNWTNIKNEYKKSDISFTKPSLEGDRAANLPSFKEYRRKCFVESYCYRYELKIDISKYFPSIYTHSIPWAIHTKETAKKHRRDDNLWGNRLDILVRNMQHGQTKGIPIGSDSSYIISEIIGSAIDSLLREKIPSLVGYRYIDDMYFYFNSKFEAELCLTEIRHILKEFELQINNDKTVITDFPIGIEDEWLVTLRKFHFDTSKEKQYSDLVSFFSLAFDYSRKYPNQAVLKYAIKAIMKETIDIDNFDFYEAMLYKTMQTDASTLPDVLRILLYYKKQVDRDRLKNVVQELIKFAVPRRYDFEIAWSLWYVITFDIVLDEETSKILNKITNPISGLLLIDIINRNLLDISKIDTSKWTQNITEDSLWDEKWILAYELSVKEWLTLSYDYIDKSKLKKNKDFKKLKDNKISFYDSSLQVKGLFEDSNDDWDYISTPINYSSEF